MKLRPSAGLVHELYEARSVYTQGAKALCLQIPLLQDKFDVVHDLKQIPTGAGCRRFPAELKLVSSIFFEPVASSSSTARPIWNPWPETEILCVFPRGLAG